MHLIPRNAQCGWRVKNTKMSGDFSKVILRCLSLFTGNAWHFKHFSRKEMCLKKYYSHICSKNISNACLIKRCVAVRFSCVGIIFNIKRS